MSLDQFSILLTIGSSILFVSLAFVVLAICTSKKLREYMARIGYFTYLWAIAGVSAFAIAGALVYQLIYLTPVCELCWIQRIFFYPIVVIALVAIWYRTREAHITAAILSVLGLLVAMYHYYYQFQKLVLGNVLALPCSYGGLLPACTDSPILIFGFVTIPLMGVLMFGSFLLLAGLAEFVKRRIDRVINNT
jgi:disulfide bond formation protein DsbB